MQQTEPRHFFLLWKPFKHWYYIIHWYNDWILYKWDRKSIILHIHHHKQECKINVPIL